MSADDKLKKAVLEELAWEPSVQQAHIGVEARDGIVTLSGHVQTFNEKHAAENAARRVKGVRAVAEEIEVRLPFESKRGDDQIAAAAANRLDWDPSVPDSVKVKVEDGRVTLDGEVEWHFQKVAAGNDVRSLYGVISVNDLITIKSAVDTSQLSETIRHALHRSWFFDSAIGVTADGGKVHLTGNVDSPYDRLVAGNTAWAAHGATSVQNDIRVN
jgi:osmotically-inducible protein OsmY